MKHSARMFGHDNPILPDDDPAGVSVDFDGTAHGLGADRIFIVVEPNQGSVSGNAIEKLPPRQTSRRYGARGPLLVR
jgi:hypothetical protein